MDVTDNELAHRHDTDLDGEEIVCPAPACQWGMKALLAIELAREEANHARA